MYASIIHGRHLEGVAWDEFFALTLSAVKILKEIGLQLSLSVL